MCEACVAKTSEEVKAEADAKVLEWARTYAWDWFEYHAGQRTSMFNYGIAAAAILAAGFGSAFEKHAMVAFAVGLVGAVVSFSFFRLDARNRYLVDRGEDVLRAVEATLFEKVVVKQSKEFPKPSGILTKIYADAKNDGFWKMIWKGKHRFHMRWVQFVFMVAFLFGAIWAYSKSKEPEAPDPVAQAIATLSPDVSAVARNVATLSGEVEKIRVAFEADARSREAAAKAQAAAAQRPVRQPGTK